MTVHSLSVPVPGAPLRPDVSMGDPAGTPDGVEITDRFVTRAGAPWIPVMGEYHFSRDDAGVWERELRKIKAGGIDVLATYVFWILHEEVRGRVRWDGDRDLRRFIELAQEVGLAVVIRIGPWAHGEARNGGFPDWLQALPVAHRTNDPEYLDLVRGWYGAIERQLRGLFHSVVNPDGPIIAVQVDNELYDQPDHLDMLRTIAEEVGMHASLWVATGWGGAILPADRLMPVYAGYSDGFWESAETEWPEFGPMHFSFSDVRDDLSVGADLRRNEAVAVDRDHRYPFVTCELGGGMHVAYHRRPHVDPIDVSALALVKIGNGSAWQGYYLYHGVTQVIGELSPTQESHDTDYPNDLPMLDYDFYAPLGSLGQVREHYHLLRRQHLFLHRFGDVLATYPAVIADSTRGAPRWAVRGDGERGFLFVNNHQPAAEPLPELSDVQFEVSLGASTVTLPTSPATLTRDSHFFWPLRQAYGSIPALSGTVQPITQFDTADDALVVFCSTDGIETELLLEGVAPSSISGGSAEQLDGGVVRVTPAQEAGMDCIVSVGSTRLLILDPYTSSRLWRGMIAGVDSLVVWDGALAFGDTLTLYTTEATSELQVLPALDPAVLPPEATRTGTTRSSLFAAYVVQGPDGGEEPAITVVAEATGVNTRRTGGSAARSSAPRDDDFDRAAIVEIALPPLPDETTDQVFLSIEWTGDAARAYFGDELVSDQFWSGRRWDIDLSRRSSELGRTLTIRALPWDPDAGIHVDARFRPDVDAPLLEIASAAITTVRSVPMSGSA